MTRNDGLWLIDGYNVLHAVVLGRLRNVAWWRRDCQQQVLDWVVVHFSEPAPERQVVLVFDSARLLPREEVVIHEWVEVVYAPNADEWMVQRCLEAQQERERNSATWIVTADRALTNRARAYGATVLKPWQLNAGAGSP